MDYSELVENFHREGKLKGGSIAREGKRNLLTKIKYFLDDMRITLKGYEIVLYRRMDKVKTPRNQLSL